MVSGAVSQESNPATVSWQRYTVKGEEFSVTLPTLPAMITTKVFLPRLQKKRLERVLTVSADGVVYSIYACENPQPRQSLEAFIAEQNAKPGWDPASERNLTIGSFPGKEYSSQDKNKPVAEQFFATEERLYRFVASGAPRDHAGVKQFFSSITLGKKQDGIKVSDGPGIPLQSSIAERIFTGKEVDTKARLLKKPEPSYTETARSAGITGTVVLKVVFSSTGQVTNIRIVEELPYGLTQRAIVAAKKIKFIPAMKDGRYVSMWMQLEYNFNLY
jgi:TonB family protein